MQKKVKQSTWKTLISILVLISMLLSVFPVFVMADNKGSQSEQSTEITTEMEESGQEETANEGSSEENGLSSEESSAAEGSAANEASSDENDAETLAITPTPFSGGHTLDISWVSTTSDGTINGTSLTNTPSKNDYQYAIVQVNFQLATGATAGVGEAEIRIPYSIFEGASFYAISLSGAEDFAYYYDDTTDEIVIYNTVTIDSNKSYVMQIGYRYRPANVVADDEATSTSSSSYIGSFDADLYISDVYEQSSNELDVKVTTKIVAGRLTKTLYSNNESWKSEWGDAPSDSADYFYLQWAIEYTATMTCTQPYTIFINDTIPAEYLTAGAYVVGYYPSGLLSNFVPGDNYSNKTVDSPYSSSTSDYYWYIVIAYPRSLYLDDDLDSITISNDATAELEGHEYGTTAGPVTGSGKYTYSTAQFEYSGDLYSVSKGVATSSLGTGSLFLLQNDKSVTIYNSSYLYTYLLGTTSRGYDQTYGLLDSGEYGYGAEEYTTTLIDDLMYLEGEQLVAGDYSIDSFYMDSVNYFYEYDAYENETTKTIVGQISTSYSSYSPIEVYYQTGGDSGSWTLLGTVKKYTASRSRFTPAGSTTAQIMTSDSQVALPNGTTGIKFVHSTNRYSVQFYPQITVSLNPTAHVKSLIEGKTSATLYNIDSLIVQDEDENIVNDPTQYTTSVPGTLNTSIVERDEVLYGNEVQHSSASITLSSSSSGSAITKTGNGPVNDETNQQAIISYVIHAYDSVILGGVVDYWDELKNLGLVHPQNEGIFYDLLPSGAYADTSSIIVSTYKYGYNNPAHTGTTCTVDSVETVENWQGSGQTMLIIKVSYPGSGDNYFFSSGTYKSGFTLTYNLHYPYESVVDYGSSVLNSVAYRAAEGTLYSGKTAAESTITNKKYFANLSDSTGNSVNDDTDQNTIYAQSTTSVSVLYSGNAGFSKRVKSQEDTQYDSDSTVYTGDTYTYQLRYRTAADVTAKNIIFYDVFEENHNMSSHWNGIFAGIDVSYIESTYPNADVKVYYSTSSGLNQNDSLPPDLSDATIWSETPPGDLSTVTAIAVDISKNLDGTDFVLPASSTVLCYVTMTAPSAYSEYLAYNNGKCYGSIVTTIGNESTFVLSSETTVDMLAKVDFEFTKVDAEDDSVLSDAKFSLYSWTDAATPPTVTDLVDISAPGSWSLVNTAVSDENGLVSFTGLTEGYYQLVETSAPTGYDTPTGQWRIEVDTTGAITISSVNDSDGIEPPDLSGTGTAADIYKLENNLSLGSITIVKMGDDGTTTLPGAVFLLEKLESDGTTWTAIKWNTTSQTWEEDTNKEGISTDGDGEIVFAELPMDTTYRITEIGAPDGYSLLKKPIEVTLPYEINQSSAETAPDDSEYSIDQDDGTTSYYYYDITFTVTDAASLNMPNAGNNWTSLMILLIGAGLALFGAGIYVTLRRRRARIKQ